MPASAPTDCCDGSDESPGSCENTCGARGLARRTEVAERLRATRAGLLRRAQYVQEAGAKLADWQAELARLRDDLSRQEADQKAADGAWRPGLGAKCIDTPRGGAPNAAAQGSAAHALPASKAPVCMFDSPAASARHPSSSLLWRSVQVDLRDRLQAREEGLKAAADSAKKELAQAQPAAEQDQASTQASDTGLAVSGGGADEDGQAGEQPREDAEPVEVRGWGRGLRRRSIGQSTPACIQHNALATGRRRPTSIGPRARQAEEAQGRIDAVPEAQTDEDAPAVAEVSVPPGILSKAKEGGSDSEQGWW